MNNDNGIKYSIITSFKKWYNLKDWFLYCLKTIALKTKLNLYRIINPKKQNKYKLFLKAINPPEQFEFVDSKKYPIVGHKQLELSLIRGFNDLKIPFKVNELSDNLIILWADKIDLGVIKRLKKEKKIKKALTVPTACQYDYNYLMWAFPTYTQIDYSLVGSNQVKEKNKKIIGEKFHDKIKPWPSGVKIEEIDLNKEPKNACICSFKKVPVNFDIVNFIKQQNITCYVVEYGNYDFNYWQNLLKQVDFVIFYQDYIETQGIAMAEAWANNRITLIKNGTSPYLTKQTGLSFNNVDELKKQILEYKDNPKEFLSQFSPYQWTKENMSDKVSVLNLIQIIENGKEKEY